MPAKSYNGSIKTVHFVYESDFPTLKQPFIHPIYYAYLVTGGNGKLRIYDNEYELEIGTLFFSFPAVPFTVKADESLKYIYVSFMGSGAQELLESLGISLKNPVHHGHSGLIDFWMSAISRVNQKNANILSESVLLYSLSFIAGEEEKSSKSAPENFFEMLVDYVDSHYRDPDLSLKKIAGIFSYTEKYISYLFKSRKGVGFSKYLNELRIQYARDLMAQRNTSVSEIAAHCGYSDPLYFSKVFRKQMNQSPTEYIRKCARRDN